MINQGKKANARNDIVLEKRPEVSEIRVIYLQIQKRDNKTIEDWHRIGCQINDLKAQIGKIYGRSLIKNLAETVQIDWSELYKASNFARSFPDVSKFFEENSSVRSWAAVKGLLTKKVESIQSDRPMSTENLKKSLKAKTDALRTQIEVFSKVRKRKNPDPEITEALEEYAQVFCNFLRCCVQKGLSPMPEAVVGLLPERNGADTEPPTESHEEYLNKLTDQYDLGMSNELEPHTDSEEPLEKELGYEDSSTQREQATNDGTDRSASDRRMNGRRRSAKKIKDEEIESAINEILQEGFFGRLHPDILIADTARKLGFKQTGTAIYERVSTTIHELVAAGKLAEDANMGIKRASH